MPQKKSFKTLLDGLNIDESFSKVLPTPKSFNKIKENIPLVADYNAMCDVLFLPTAKLGYKYLFVIVDLATNKFDIEPIKNKDDDVVLKAMKKCFARDYVKEPKFTLKTDSGNEFKGVFQKYLYDESIYHKVSPPNHHAGMGNVDSLCRQLGRLIMGYLNLKEIEKGKTYKNWLDIIPYLRKELNEYRDISDQLPKNINTYVYPTPDDAIEHVKQKKGKYISSEYELIKPKFKIGDFVYHYLDIPKDALGKNQPTKQRRAGDYNWNRTPIEIEKIYVYTGNPLYRYKLKNIKNVSFTENQLMKV